MFLIVSVSYPLYWTSQVALVVKNPPANAGDLRDTGSIPGSGRSPGEGNGQLLQYSCLQNPMKSMKRQNDRILKEELSGSVRCPICYQRSVEK